VAGAGLGWLQDVTVGYGYQPSRAALWLLALLVIGTASSRARIRASPGRPPPAFNPSCTPVRFDS